MFSQGAASQEGTLSRGDFLLSVNGTSLAGLAPSEVAKVLHQAQLHKHTLMIVQKGNGQPRPSLREEPRSTYGKGPLPRKTLPLEPGAGKSADSEEGVYSWLIEQTGQGLDCILEDKIAALVTGNSVWKERFLNTGNPRETSVGTVSCFERNIRR